jgi:hypothetical protein
MTNITSPKVFVSYATEDKERFVEAFAIKLRANGIDAWFDKWEIMPGDSLVDKIFEEGIKAADIFIIILSEASVQKPWVREELNTSVVNRIIRKTKIIPIVIDNCDIPESLRSIRHVKIANLRDYDEDLREVISSIFNLTNKPSLGEPPKYVRLEIDSMPGLSKIDTEIFKIACEITIETGDFWVRTNIFQNRVRELDISDRDVEDSIYILEDRMLIEAKWLQNGFVPLFKITTHGFENYGKFYLPDFNDTINNTLLTILNHNIKTNGAIGKFLNKPPILSENS